MQPGSSLAAQQAPRQSMAETSTVCKARPLRNYVNARESHELSRLANAVNFTTEASDRPMRSSKHASKPTTGASIGIRAGRSVRSRREGFTYNEARLSGTHVYANKRAGKKQLKSKGSDASASNAPSETSEPALSPMLLSYAPPGRDTRLRNITTCKSFQCTNRLLV